MKLNKLPLLLAFAVQYWLVFDVVVAQEHVFKNPVELTMPLSGLAKTKQVSTATGEQVSSRRLRYTPSERSVTSDIDVPLVDFAVKVDSEHDAVDVLELAKRFASYFEDNIPGAKSVEVTGEQVSSRRLRYTPSGGSAASSFVFYGFAVFESGSPAPSVEELEKKQGSLLSDVAAVIEVVGCKTEDSALCKVLEITVKNTKSDPVIVSITGTEESS